MTCVADHFRARSTRLTLRYGAISALAALLYDARSTPIRPAAPLRRGRQIVVKQPPDGREGRSNGGIRGPCFSGGMDAGEHTHEPMVTPEHEPENEPENQHGPGQEPTQAGAPASRAEADELLQGLPVPGHCNRCSPAFAARCWIGGCVRCRPARPRRTRTPAACTCEPP